MITVHSLQGWYLQTSEEDPPQASRQSNMALGDPAEQLDTEVHAADLNENQLTTSFWRKIIKNYFLEEIMKNAR